MYPVEIHAEPRGKPLSRGSIRKTKINAREKLRGFVASKGNHSK